MSARTAVLAGSASVAALAVLLAPVLSPWTLLALPLCLVAGFGAFVGLDLDRFSQAVGFADDDLGRGTPGLLP